MARVPFSSGSDSGSDSTNTTAGDDDSQQNRREAVEEDPGSALSGIGLTDDGSSNTDTGRSNRRQAINEGPGGDVSQPTSGGSNDTTPDDNTSNRQAAANADQQLSQGIDNTEDQQTTGSDPTGARREAVEQEPDVPVRPSGPDIDPGDARQEAVAAEQQRTGQQTQPDPQPTNDRPSTGGEELERLRREAAASQDNLGPSDVRITQSADGQVDVQLSDEGIRQQATGDIPTLDADDVRIGEDGSVELTRQARQQRVRSQAALNLGVSQREINVFGDADGDLQPQLTDEGFTTAASRQAASQSEGLSAEDFQLTSQNGERQVTLTDAALREQATTGTDALQAGDVRITGEGADRSVELTGQGRERLEAAREDEQFGDFEINIPGLNRSLEEIAGDTAEGIQQTFGGVADGLAAQATSDGAGVTQSLNPDGALVSYGAGGIRGVGDLASLPFSAFVAGKEGVELVGYGANETLQGRGGEFAGDLGAATIEAVDSGARAVERNPFGVSGRLVSGAALSGGAIAGATRVGGATAGRATSALIQPGEELARYAARTGRIPTSAATRVPGVTERNIDSAAAANTGTSFAGRASSRVRGAVDDATPEVNVRYDADAGPLELNTDLRQALQDASVGAGIRNRAQSVRDRFNTDSASASETTVDATRIQFDNTPLGDGDAPLTRDGTPVEQATGRPSQSGADADGADVIEIDASDVEVGNTAIGDADGGAVEPAAFDVDDFDFTDLEDAGTRAGGYISDTGERFRASNPLGTPLATQFSDASVSAAVRDFISGRRGGSADSDAPDDLARPMSLFVDDSGNAFTERNPLGTPLQTEFGGQSLSARVPSLGGFRDRVQAPSVPSFEVPRPSGRLRDLTVSIGRRSDTDGRPFVDADDLELELGGPDLSDEFGFADDTRAGAGSGDATDFEGPGSGSGTAQAQMTDTGGQTATAAVQQRPNTNTRTDTTATNTDSTTPTTPLEFVQNLEDASQFAGPQTPDVGGFGGIEPTIGDVGGTFGTPTTEFSFDLGSDTGTTTGTETTTETGTGPGIRPDTGTTTAIDFGIDTVTETEASTPTERRFPNVGRGREAEERSESVLPQRDEEGFELDWPFDEESELEETGILSAEDVRQSF